MVASRITTAFRGLFCLMAVAAFALPQSAAAQSVDKADQGCINTMNKSGQKVAKTQGKENSKCLKSAGAGKLTGTAEACVTGDSKGKVGKAQGKTASGQAKKCVGTPPSFGFADSSVINAAAVAEELSLLHDIYGANLDAAVLSDKAGAGCQSAVAKAYEKFAATRGKQFVSCKKSGLKDGVITDASGLEACISDDAKNKVSKARGKIVSGVDKKCVGVDLAAAFPGECQGATATNQAFADCIAEASDCRMCTAINAYDGLNRGCDTFDNGLLDGSCRQCGNGVAEAPEACDDSGNSAVCDSDCTAAVCGDGFVNSAASESCDDSGESASCDADCTAAVCLDGTLNVSAGEECDDGAESAACDADCTAAVCGDGTVNATAGESCDDSGESALCDADCTAASCGDGTLNVTAGEGCDNGGANSDVTPDACRSNCQPASCGDGVTDSGEQCDDAGQSASCDADCTLAVCGDGIVNALAGEICDDAGESAACDANCTPAVCGDGTVNATAGEICDDAGESAACDANCTPAVCGDGTVNATAGEICDDAGESAACDANCTLASCGDGTLNTTAGETCDDGGANSDVLPNACRSNCQLAGCGDGVIDAGEACDDAGESAACDANCTLAACGDGTVNTTAGEQCDDAGESSSCDADCSLAICGDGTLNTTSGEVCDDGGANSDVTPDACRTNCQPASCGDGITDSGEFCDDAGNSAACDADCSAPACGDGFTNPAAGESCDDAGESASCDADCTAAACGDGVLNITAGEECDDFNTTPGDGCNATCQCGPGSGEVGCQDVQCPTRGELVLFAGTTGVACTSNLDCPVGTCDVGLGRCITTTRLDTGFTGIAHGSDINDQVLTVGTLICPGPFDALNAEPCGDCTVAGLNPDPGYCRCQGDNRTVCDQPFAVDNVNCGGGICDCFFGAPLPLSSGNTPVCVVNRFFDDISGTANVDAGSGAITANLRSVAHLGESLVLPCPVCGGTCTAGLVGSGCATDLDCDTGLASGTFNNDGTCSNYDATANDGLRGGTCFKGLNDGQSCDIGAFHESFPAPGGAGAGASLDCFPASGKNVSGTGLKISLNQTTGTSALPVAGVKCGFPVFAESLCPCGQCLTGPGTFTADTCTSNADCMGIGIGTCGNPDGAVFPNSCENGLCSDIGGGRGECTTGPNDGFCDGLLLSNGSGFIGCLSNADCSPAIIGLPGGNCTLTTRRSCFLDPITATGAADPNTPVGVAAFCVGATGNTGLNSVAGLPGPGLVTNAAAATTFCSDGVTAYTPGVGGCP